VALIARRPVAHDARLTLTEHLDELRSRLIICALALVVAFGFTFWQNEAVLDFVNEPLEQTQNLDGKERSNDPLEQAARFQILQGRALEAQRRLDEALAATDELPADVRALARAAARASAVAAEAVPSNRERQPVTLGVAEPFTTTWTVACR
jgi:sec-independent protein translocase protein TatC